MRLIKIHKDLPFPDYQALPGVNASSLKPILTSEKHFMHSKTHREDSPALLLGRAVHTLVLEPELFDEEFAVYPGKARRGTNYDQYVKEAGSKQIMLESELRTAEAMAKSIHEHPVVGPMLQSAIATETSVQFEVDVDGEPILCKARLDAVTAKGILDVKTTKDIVPRTFAKDCLYYRYHIQAAFYSDAYKAAYGEAPEFYFIPIEKAPPHDCWIGKLPKETVDQGRIEYMQGLKLYTQVMKKLDTGEPLTGVDGGEILTIPAYPNYTPKMGVKEVVA